MLNKITKVYKKPVLIRQLLKNTKVDISLLDLVVQSLVLYKEIKHFCIYITKKKKPKVKKSQKIALMSASFNL